MIIDPVTITVERHVLINALSSMKLRICGTKSGATRERIERYIEKLQTSIEVADKT